MEEFFKMAWRPTYYLVEGELDNTVLGKITGWMKFAGMAEKVAFDLKGDFHRDIQGAKIYLTGDALENEPGASGYMKGFATKQKGCAGDITAGLYPYDYIKGRCYIEWYSDENGRVVIELEQDQLQIISEPIPADNCKPISRKEQAQNMAGFIGQVAEEFGLNIEGGINQK